MICGMSSNPTDRMKDSFYAGLLIQIERMIYLTDKEARENGVELTDSQIRSALIKARKLAQGEAPAIPEATPRDQVLAKLIHSLQEAPGDLLVETRLPDGTIEEGPLPMVDWVKALETVMDSIKTRRRGLSGSRGYLSFLPGFLAEAGGLD